MPRGLPVNTLQARPRLCQVVTDSNSKEEYSLSDSGGQTCGEKKSAAATDLQRQLRKDVPTITPPFSFLHFANNDECDERKKPRQDWRFKVCPILVL